jgi:hypothetical protein
MTVRAGRRQLPPVVVVQGYLSGLVEGVGFGYLEGRWFPRHRGRLARFRLCRLGLFESVSLRDFRVSWHIKAKSTPGERLSSGPAAPTGTTRARRRTARSRGAVSRQRKRHNHPPYGWAP